MRRSVYAFLLFGLAFTWLNGCRGDTPKRIPGTLPDVRGYIKTIKRTSGNGTGKTAVILLQSLEGEETAYKQASVRIDGSTLIEDDHGAAMTMEQFREGHQVEAWLEGDLLESAPIQGTAKAIRVEE